MRAYQFILVLFLALSLSGVTHARALPIENVGDFGDEGNAWIIICSASGILYLNLETGEKKAPNVPFNQDSTMACHDASSQCSLVKSLFLSWNSYEFSGCDVVIFLNNFTKTRYRDHRCIS